MDTHRYITLIKKCTLLFLLSFLSIIIDSNLNLLYFPEKIVTIFVL